MPVKQILAALLAANAFNAQAQIAEPFEFNLYEYYLVSGAVEGNQDFVSYLTPFLSKPGYEQYFQDNPAVDGMLAAILASLNQSQTNTAIIAELIQSLQTIQLAEAMTQYPETSGEIIVKLAQQLDPELDESLRQFLALLAPTFARTLDIDHLLMALQSLLHETQVDPQRVMDRARDLLSALANHPLTLSANALSPHHIPLVNALLVQLAQFEHPQAIILLEELALLFADSLPIDVLVEILNLALSDASDNSSHLVIKAMDLLIQFDQLYSTAPIAYQEQVRRDLEQVIAKMVVGVEANSMTLLLNRLGGISWVDLVGAEQLIEALQALSLEQHHNAYAMADTLLGLLVKVHDRYPLESDELIQLGVFLRLTQVVGDFNGTSWNPIVLNTLSHFGSMMHPQDLQAIREIAQLHGNHDILGGI